MKQQTMPHHHEAGYQSIPENIEDSDDEIDLTGNIDLFKIHL
jgi:hypothetical protein